MRRHYIVAAGLVAALLLTMPFAREATGRTEALLPAYAAATGVLEIMTAALLFALYNVQRSRALLILAAGYLFSALMVPVWALSFPGVFTALGIDFGAQTTAAVAALRRLGFPLFVLGYAFASGTSAAGRFTGVAVFKTVLLVSAGAALAVGFILTHQDRLPAFMRDERHINDIWLLVSYTGMALYVAGIAVLLVRRRSPLDIWVSLVLFSLVIELMLISFLGGGIRLSIGWWAGRLYGLTAASIVLAVLLFETTGVYARLSATIAAERRARQNRLTAMEALSASIAHEINQPLASMITNADAALRWLARSEPRLDRVEDALHRIVADGHRSNKVVAGIRTMFMKGAQERAEVDLNALVREAVTIAGTEARFEGIAIELELADALPPIIGNAVQLHQVLCNLIENGIDAIKSAHDRQRLLVIRTGFGAYGELHARVADSGTGIAPGMAERLFDPFVSTKPGGMGMGLMFCRSVIEAHGGRIWATANQPRGAVFHFSLPAAILPRDTAEQEP
ncbi:MASE4 domain-containing protein [Ancylobacter sp. A5.8]|uniref:MASE4 domain-containing protein n=1 Tax=Ancylobacter gelatini TaxID=2919920 RepID=UPI001F4D7788|nr:ATP-binding protein [Ancylobacter gelatini]MCJ8142564.1 MASE4 domain-containing protein [Ancylobacter gelatini]